MFLPEPHTFENGIELVNDTKTPMQFVIQVLQAHAGLSVGDATAAMAICHSKGGVVIPTSSKHAAEQAAATITNNAREAGYPLACRPVGAVESNA
jgi:ATP-dependent Clp protease adapter protein ClpS